MLSLSKLRACYESPSYVRSYGKGSFRFFVKRKTRRRIRRFLKRTHD